ncbi:MAG: hypothetical protein UF405_02340 [Acutalibacteraceae bacterium]|nr:hypothetical protein [Acutalibacteraceae bacterium]
MNAPVISAATARQLNLLVQAQIDSHLFLFCNYEPTHSCAISEDAQFLTAVQDLYKFAIDSSCILKNYFWFVLRPDRNRFDQISKIIEKIKAIRAVIDHNQSANNGMVEQNLIQTCATWVRSVLGKPKPTTLQDFAVLTAKLIQMGDDLIRLTEKWILYIGHKADADKAKDIAEWTKRTLQWYCYNSKTEIYKGQLMTAYLARATASSRCNYISDSQLQKKVNKWIDYAYYFSRNVRIEELESNIACIENCSAPLTANQHQVLRQLVADYRKQLESEKQEMADLQTQINGNSVAYFYRNLETQLRSTISTLEANQAAYTLLPQDLLQEDIQLFFGNIPSPEGDF